MVEIVKFNDPSLQFKRQKGQTTTKSSSITRANDRNKHQQQISEKPASTETVLRNLQSNIAELEFSQLKGKQRRQYTLDKLTSLGLPPSQHTTKNGRRRVPMRMALEMTKKARERASNQKKSLREQGHDLVVSTADRVRPVNSLPAKSYSAAPNKNNKSSARSIEYQWSSKSHPMRQTFDRKQRKLQLSALDLDPESKKKNMGRVGSVDIRTGRMRNGCLHLSNREIKKISNSK